MTNPPAGAHVSPDESIGRYAVQQRGYSGMWLLMTGSGEVVGTELTWPTIDDARAWGRAEAAWERRGQSADALTPYRIVRIDRTSVYGREFVPVEVI